MPLNSVSLLGEPLPSKRDRVNEELSQEHIDEEIDRAAGEIAARFDEIGGLPNLDSGAGFSPYGPAPLKQVRQVFVAKYNPGEADPVQGRFLQSDPFTVPELWDHAGPPECWVSDELGHNRTTPAHAAIDAGDLIFVFRSQPKIDGDVLPDPTKLGGRPHLIGVWWVSLVHRRWLPAPRNRVVTNAWHVPLVRFSEPVDVRIIRHHPELSDLGPFTNQTRAGLVQATPKEAAALAAACSLPSWVLTDLDPVSMAKRLAGVRTGARPDDLAYRSSTRARYQFVHAIEVAASERVQKDFDNDGWSVISKERCPGYGADLSCWRMLRGHPLEHRDIEVKGKQGHSLGSVVLQRSQYEEALKSATVADGRWWLVMCPRALDVPPPPVVQWDAHKVALQWPAHMVR